MLETGEVPSSSSPEDDDEDEEVQVDLEELVSISLPRNVPSETEESLPDSVFVECSVGTGDYDDDDDDDEDDKYDEYVDDDGGDADINAANPSHMRFESDNEDGPPQAKNAPTTKNPAKDPRAGRKGKKYLEPNCDNDPSEVDKIAEDYVYHPPDPKGWSRNVKRVRTQPFSGPEPAGPTFECTREKPAVFYFLQFFPLQLFTMICKFTNKVMAGERNDDGSPSIVMKITTTAKIKAWFGIRFAMACMKISNSKKYWSAMAGWKNNLIFCNHGTKQV